MISAGEVDIISQRWKTFWCIHTIFLLLGPVISFMYIERASVGQEGLGTIGIAMLVYGLFIAVSLSFVVWATMLLEGSTRYKLKSLGLIIGLPMLSTIFFILIGLLFSKLSPLFI